MKNAEFDKSIVTINEDKVEIPVEEIADYIAFEMSDNDIKKMLKKLLENENGGILKMMFDLACSKITSSEEYESTTRTAVKLAKSLFNNDFNEIW